MSVERIEQVISATRTRLGHLAHELIRPCTVAIYGQPVGEPIKQVGSATLLEDRGRKILVTAAHVFAAEKGTSFWIVGPSGLIGISGDDQLLYCLDSPDDTQASDTFDLAIIDLSADQVRALEGLIFIPMHSVGDHDSDAKQRLLIISGYPNSKNKRAVVASKPIVQHSICLSTISSPSSEWVGKLEFNPYQNFLLAAPSMSSDASGNEQRTLSVRGMSGGPIVDLGEWSLPDVLSGKLTPTPRVIGILTRHIKKHELFVGSKLRPALPVLFKGYLC